MILLRFRSAPAMGAGKMRHRTGAVNMWAGEV
jgi:hypothetical protein